MEKIDFLRQVIIDNVFIKNRDEQIDTHESSEAWILDFRRITMNGTYSDIISEIFYENYRLEYPFQLCTLEVAGIPLTTSLMTKFFYKGHREINAFYIRKSRKKNGLMRMVEGTINSEKIILIDDINCTGNTFWRQVEVLEQLGHRVDSVWSIIKYHDDEYYRRFTDRGIKVKSLFNLNDFTKYLGIKNLSTTSPQAPVMPFEPIWKFSGEKPSYGYVQAKSQPLLDEDKLYVGLDNQTFISINQSDGSIAWRYETGYCFGKKGIFSDPVLYKDLVIFGSCDGNIYALNKDTGKRVWVCFEGDYIGSSPTLATDSGIIFIGLEYGVFKKTGGIVALKAETGERIWIDNSNTAATSASPLYINKYKLLILGYDDGNLKTYDAQNGKLLWTFTAHGKIPRDTYSYTSSIKGKAIYDKLNDSIIFGSLDGGLYIISRKTGALKHRYSCEFGIYSTPIIVDNRVYFSSVDKKIHCLNLTDFTIKFVKIIDNTRIFSSPTLINDRLYVGTNAGRLHEISKQTGDSVGYFQTTERITNQLVYNPKNHLYFLPTYANEIYCLRRKGEAT